MSKAEEFGALPFTAAAYEGPDNDVIGMNAQLEIGWWALGHRDVIARALRRDEIVQDISMSDIHKLASDAVKGQFTRETERDFAAKVVSVLVAFREAVK